MSKWAILSLISIFLVASFILAFELNSPISGQVIAASASISVFAVGFWLYFKKPKCQ